MTIRAEINIRELRTQFDDFEQCAEYAPDGAYEEAKAIKRLIGETADNLISELKALGLKADNCDLIREVELVIYGYIKASNPDATVFPVSEGFGSAMDTPARDRVIANAANSIAFLRSVGAAPAGLGPN